MIILEIIKKSIYCYVNNIKISREIKCDQISLSKLGYSAYINDIGSLIFMDKNKNIIQLSKQKRLDPNMCKFSIDGAFLLTINNNFSDIGIYNLKGEQIKLISVNSSIKLMLICGIKNFLFCYYEPAYYRMSNTNSNDITFIISMYKFIKNFEYSEYSEIYHELKIIDIEVSGDGKKFFILDDNNISIILCFPQLDFHVSNKPIPMLQISLVH